VPADGQDVGVRHVAVPERDQAEPGPANVHGLQSGANVVITV
jgi:hypothetical protein